MSDIVISGSESVLTLPSSDFTTALYIELCKQYLYTGSHEIRDKLSATIDASNPSLTLTFNNDAFQPGIKVSCELEDMYVWSKSSSTLTVERGQFGSTASAHTGGAMVYASPKFSDAEIFRELNRGINALSAPGALFRVNTLDITTLSAARAYEITDPLIMDILDISVRVPGTTDDWQPIGNWRMQVSAGSDFPSGVGVFVYDAIPANTTLHITYSTPFSLLTSLTNDVMASTGLAQSQLDLPLYAAAVALTSGREIKRNWTETQGQTRRASEVPPGANLSSSNALRAQYRMRLVEEANKLRKLYPNRKKRVWDYGI